MHRIRKSGLDAVRPGRRRTGLLTAAALTAAVATLIPSQAAHAIGSCLSDNPPPQCDFTPPPPPPPPRVATPTNLGVSNVTSQSAYVAWTDYSQDETGFVVTRYQRPTAASAPKVDTFVVAAPPGVTSFGLPQTDLLPQETVQWTVQATKTGSTSSYAASTGTLTVDLPAGTPALGQLAAFRADWQGSAFPNVNKAAVLADAAHIINNPLASIAQGQTGACGPATAEVQLVSRDPGRFVDSVRSIADYGSFTTPDGTTYSAHTELRNSAPNPTVTPANWLFLATLKDSGNAVRITGSTGADDAAWISSPADVDNWLAHVVGLPMTTATAIVRPFTYGETVMPGANSVLQGGGAVVLLVDSSLVGNDPGLISEPNHYVNLLSWSSTASTVTFRVATWGQVKTITTAWSNFDGLTWDVLTAR